MIQHARWKIKIKKRNFFQFSCGCEQFHYDRSFGFLVINICNPGKHYGTPCITFWKTTRRTGVTRSITISLSQTSSLSILITRIGEQICCPADIYGSNHVGLYQWGEIEHGSMKYVLQPIFEGLHWLNMFMVIPLNSLLHSTLPPDHS